jgi:DNA anti-recombination protein RmuC
MGLGGTAKKLQNVIDAAEQLYSKMNEIIGELKDLQTEVEITSKQVDRMEQELAEQRALLEALAEQENVDVDAALGNVTYPDSPEVEAETDEDESGADGVTAETGGDGD